MTEKVKEMLLKLDLQHFAEKEEEEGEVEEKDVDEKEEELEEKEGNEGEGKDEGETKTFTEEDVAEIVAKKLAELKEQEEKAKEEALRKKEQEELESEGKYEELYKSLKEENEELKAKFVNTTRANALAVAGYAQEQVEFLVGSLKGTEEDEIKAEVEKLKEVFPVKTYVDPSAVGNVGKGGGGQKKSGEDVGRTLFSKIMGN